jgi:hypothetical protein
MQKSNLKCKIFACFVLERHNKKRHKKRVGKCTHTEDSSLWEGEGLCYLQPVSNLLADVWQAQKSARLPRPRPLKVRFHKICISSNPHFSL